MYCQSSSSICHRQSVIVCTYVALSVLFAGTVHAVLVPHLTHSVCAHTMCDMWTDSRWMFILRSAVSCTGHVRSGCLCTHSDPGVGSIPRVCVASALSSVCHCTLPVLYTWLCLVQVCVCGVCVSVCVCVCVCVCGV